MRKLIVEEWMSLDGYVADRQSSLDFFIPLIRDSYSDSEGADFIQRIGLIVFGRKTYEQFAAIWPGRGTDNPLASMINQTPKIVLSNTISTAPWGNWPEGEVAKGNVGDIINGLKASAGNNIVVWGSISLAQNLMVENLVDEYRLHVCPTLTRGGRKFFSTEDVPAMLSLIEARQKNGAVMLRYEPLKPKT